MQIRLFIIPVGDESGILEEMNAFLRNNTILELENQFVSNGKSPYCWFCVRYLERASGPADQKKAAAKVDYRQVLDEATFQKFSKLREVRKQAAAEEGVSAFIICTDEELSEMAKLEEVTASGMLGIKGIGDKKVERYGKYFMTKPAGDAKTGQSD